MPYSNIQSNRLEGRRFQVTSYTQVDLGGAGLIG